MIVETGCKLDPIADKPPAPPAEDTFVECEGWAACLTADALAVEDAYDEARSRWATRIWTLCGPSPALPLTPVR